MRTTNKNGQKDQKVKKNENENRVEKKIAEKINIEITSVNMFKNMPHTNFKLPNIIKKEKQMPTPKIKWKTGPKVASISTYFEEKNNKETKKFKSSTGQQDVETIQHLKLNYKLTNFDLNFKQGQYPLKKSSRGKRSTKARENMLVNPILAKNSAG